jgi:hypothetical protein
MVSTPAAGLGQRRSLAAWLQEHLSSDRRFAWLIGLLFTLVTAVPVIRRLLHPAILTDDILRLVNIIEHPLRELLFQPCNEHVAVAFDIQSWLTWQLIGHDLRLAPLAYSLAAAFPWLILLALLFRWLNGESRSPTASVIAVALIAQSPLVLEVVWWYSASCFAWAIVAILVAISGASLAASRPRRAVVQVLCATLLAPAATSLGHLAVPLVLLRAFLVPTVSRRRRYLIMLSAIGGNLAYHAICTAGGLGPIANARQHNAQMAAPLEGLAYAFTVPARVLLPSAIGLPAHSWATALPSWTHWISSTAVFICLVTILVVRRASWNRPLMVLGIAMIYLGYGLAYGARAGLVKDGRITEIDFI